VSAEVTVQDADEYWMAAALEEADRARALREVPIGCVLVAGSTIVGRGHNLREARQDPTAHAEIFALQAASATRRNFRLEDLTAYVTLEPCPMCAGALVLARVKRVVYGCTDPKAGAVDTLFGIGKTAALNHQFEVTGGVLEDACSSRLRTFFSELRAQGKRG
jgi:tRNA(adenine34) deaminase